MTIHRALSRRQPLALALLALQLAGCASLLPEAQKIDVQQGKVLDADAIATLEQGLSQSRVRELLGDPVLKTPFHGRRWDYVYYRTQAGEDVQPERLSLYFGEAGLERIVNRYTPPQDPVPPVPGGRLPDVERPARSRGGPGPGPGGPGPSPSPSPGPGPRP